MQGVHFRTLPAPQDAQEDTIREALLQLEAVLADAEHADAAALPEVVVEARGAARVVRRTWEILPGASPYRTVLPDAGFLVGRIAALGWEAAPALARDLETERADLLLLDARQPLMLAVQAGLEWMGIREFARSTGLSVGRLSELSHGRGGLPTERTARALESVVGPGLVEIVRVARAEAASIRRAAGSREKGISARSAAPVTTDGLMRVALALGDDAELLALVQQVVALPLAERSALSTLLFRSS